MTLSGTCPVKASVLIAAAILCAAGAAQVIGVGGGAIAAAAEVEAPAVTLDAAVAAVRKQSGGRVVGTEEVNEDAAKFYRIKVLLADGRVRVYTVNAQTGSIEE